MKRIYEVTAWRPETYTTSDTFKADSPADALAQAKAAFEDERGESCYSGEAWSEFMVSQNGEQLLIESPDQRCRLTQQTDLNAPWTLHFDRDGTEDVAIICDSNGEDLVQGITISPGTWQSAPDEVAIISKNGEEQYLIGVAHWGGQRCPIDCQVISREEAEANSTLMAAAPKMLEVLRILEKRCAVLGWSEPEMRVIHHAIAEATGRAA